jgi:lipopolysaccharide/colanic/teichoic acid biosynthesis glycosyltransferase
MKRVFDFASSLIGLIILSPLLIIISLLIICTSKGGIFFRGERVGKKGGKFRIFKFRSMVKDAEGKGNWNVGNHDPRITKIGVFLRKTKLDELPQLINVIKGEMSIVGPRPELVYYVDMYTDNERPILDLKPGITDWASMVNIAQFELFTNAEDPDVAYLKYIRPIKIKLQLYYRYNNSFFGDLHIIFWTIYKVITRSNKLPKKIRQFVSELNNGGSVNDK